MSTRILAMAFLGLMIANYANAQEEPEPVQWQIETAALQVTPGQKVTVKLTAELDHGWHIYSLTQGEGGPTPTQISMPAGQPFTLAGKVIGGEPQSNFDENFGIQVEQYEETTSFTVPVAVASKVDGSVTAIKIDALFQACTASLCLPPQTTQLSVPVTLKK